MEFDQLAAKAEGLVFKLQTILNQAKTLDNNALNAQALEATQRMCAIASGTYMVGAPSLGIVFVGGKLICY